MNNGKDIKRILTRKYMEDYKKHMEKLEKSANTIKKYLRDINKLVEFVRGREMTKELLIEYKESLISSGKYKGSSINSFLVAANRLFEYLEWHELKLNTIKIQQEAYCPENRELTKREYEKLVSTAKAGGNLRLAMVIMTICATGIRVGELSSITVGSIKKGMVIVNNKGKMRHVLISHKLRKELLVYINTTQITDGQVFITKSGKAISRTNIWRDMKKLCEKACVDKKKVFPHNLRHLFARTYYGIKKDIVKLATLMGHENIETTRIYLKCSMSECLKELDMLGLVV